MLDMPFSLLFIGLALLLATLSYYAVETPLRTQSARLKQVLGYGLLAGTALATGPSMGAININQALSPAPLPIEYQRYADPATICHGQIVDDCLKGDLNTDKEVRVLGDSHAAMLDHFFDQLGKEFRFKAGIITASSCVTIPGFDYQRIPECAQNPCQTQINQAQEHLPTAKVIFLAASWDWPLVSTDFQDALKNFLFTLIQAGARIHVMEQEPLLRKNPIRVLRLQSMGLAGSRINIDLAYQQANPNLRSLASHRAGITKLNFEASVFFDFAPFADGNPLYMGEHHLNEVGAKPYANAARGAFTKIIN